MALGVCMRSEIVGDVQQFSAGKEAKRPLAGKERGSPSGASCVRLHVVGVRLSDR